MCIHPRPIPSPNNSQIIRIPRARPVSLVTALRRRDIDRSLAFLAALSRDDDDPSTPAPAAAMRRVA